MMPNPLGVWVLCFLLEHLIGERNLARNTQSSYRDALVLLLPFVTAKLNKSLERLTPIDLSGDLVRLFLTVSYPLARISTVLHRNPQPEIGCAPALARFVGERSPEHIVWYVSSFLRRRPPQARLSTICCSE